MGRLVKKQLNGINLLGFSLAGEETVIAAPEYNVCFDVGRAPREIIAIDNVCLSHGHMDHAAGLAYYLSQRGFIGNSPGRVIVHRALAQSIQKLMEVWADIEGHHSPGQILGVESLEDVELRRDLIVRPFNVNHAASALGYTLLEVRHKLKNEFVGKSGPELVALKKEGVTIQDRVETPVLTFSGDTAVGRFLEHDFVRHSAAMILECTFFEPEHLERAQAGRHIHINDLPKILEAVPDAQIMLTHLSRRTDLRVAKRILKLAVKPADFERLSFLMERDRMPHRAANPAQRPEESRENKPWARQAGER